jgi:hypothetical protein
MKRTFYKPIILTMMLIITVVFHVNEPCAETTDAEAGYSRSYQTEDSTSTQENRRHPRRGGGPLMQVLDVDKDRTLSAEEIASASNTLLTLDTNGDGIISHSELRPEKSSSKQGGRHH